LYCSPILLELSVKDDRIGRVCRMGQMWNASDIVRKPEEKTPFGRRICRWKSNVEINGHKILGVGWIYVSLDREWRKALAEELIKLRAP
jgi:hypothetical protein